MVYKFIIVSNESDDFMREIKIDSDATFLDFHKAILTACGYTDDQLTSFTLCDDHWERGLEITMIEMDTSFDSDSYVMSDTVVGDLIEEEKQHLVYTFDPLNGRVFFMELEEILTGVHLPSPVLTRSQGTAPVQLLDIDAPVQNTQTNAASLTNVDEDGESFYGEQFDSDDLETEGLDISEGNPFA